MALVPLSIHPSIQNARRASNYPKRHVLNIIRNNIIISDSIIRCAAIPDYSPVKPPLSYPMKAIETMDRLTINPRQISGKRLQFGKDSILVKAAILAKASNLLKELHSVKGRHSAKDSNMAKDAIQEKESNLLKDSILTVGVSL